MNEPKKNDGKDQFAAVVAMVSAVLCGMGLPEKLGMSTEVVTMVGAAVIASAALCRGMVDYWRGEPVKVADVVGLFLSAVIGSLASYGIVVPLTADQVATLGSLAAMVAAYLRGRYAAHPGTA